MDIYGPQRLLQQGKPDVEEIQSREEITREEDAISIVFCSLFALHVHTLTMDGTHDAAFKLKSSDQQPAGSFFFFTSVIAMSFCCCVTAVFSN